MGWVVKRMAMRKYSSRTMTLGALLVGAQFFGVFLPSCGSTAASRAESAVGPDRPASAPLMMPEAIPFLAPGFTGPTALETQESDAEGMPVFVSRSRIVEGDAKGGLIVVERSDAGEGRWRLRTYLEPSGASGPGEQSRRLLQDEVVGRSAEGGAALLESINHAEGVIVRIAPALLILPGALGVDEEFTQKARMTLPLISNPARLREQGAVTKSMRVEGWQRLEAEGGSFDCVRVRETHVSHLSLAKSERITTSWYAPGVGLIAQRYTEEVKALGLTVRSRARSIEAILP